MALHRFEARRRAFDAAAGRAALLQRPLIVVGDPDAGTHTRIIRAYGCGDLCVDINGCPLCPVTRTADITKGPVAGLANDSAVVFVSCVLEYVSDPEAAPPHGPGLLAVLGRHLHDDQGHYCACELERRQV